MPYSAWAPLAGWADLVVLIVRVIMGGVMVYYGWPKVKDPGKTFDDFVKIGFTPGWFWGTIVLLVEFAGGIAIIVGFYTWVPSWCSSWAPAPTRSPDPSRKTKSLDPRRRFDTLRRP